MRVVRHGLLVVFGIFIVPVTAATVSALPPPGFERINPADFHTVVITAHEPNRPLSIAVAPTPRPYIEPVVESMALMPTPVPRPRISAPTAKAKSVAITPKVMGGGGASITVVGTVGVVEGSRIARAYAQTRLSSAQYACLNNLWIKESGWRWNAGNPTSGAYGIPQALPGTKMATAGSDWRTNPITQVKWGLGYVSGRYGTACNAWNHWLNYNWY